MVSSTRANKGKEGKSLFKVNLRRSTRHESNSSSELLLTETVTKIESETKDRSGASERRERVEREGRVEREERGEGRVEREESREEREYYSQSRENFPLLFGVSLKGF